MTGLSLPPWWWWVVGVPLAAGWTWLWWSAAGQVKARLHWRTGYTRKLIHLATFLSASVVQWCGGAEAVYVFGVGASLVLGLAVWRGDGHPIYEAMARESDFPYRTRFILIPYATTVLGGMVATVGFGDWAILGYLVGGLGDAVGEPVGVRFGRHRYRVPCFWLRATRSLEGSAAVLVVSFGGLLAGCAILGLALDARTLLSCIAIAVAAALAEAVSPHGWDNLTMQVIPVWLAAAWL
jgi:phytol kinase